MVRRRGGHHTLSTLMETHLGPFLGILSSKTLLHLYLNNPSPFLDNDVYLIYVHLFPPHIFFTSIGKTWSLKMGPCATLLGHQHAIPLSLLTP